MKPRTEEFRRIASATMANETIQKNLLNLDVRFNQARQKSVESSPNWGRLQKRGRQIRSHAIDNLDYYVDLAASNIHQLGGKVCFAKDASTANRYIHDLARSRNVKNIIKSKSMASEEIGLSNELAKSGINAVETDLGEYIIQLAGETPYHILAPAIHKSKEDVAMLMHEKVGSPLHKKISDIANEARNQLRSKFIDAEMGVTGANFIVAESGTLVLVTNEGNGRMCTSMPKIHVAVVGMEKVIPSMEDLGILLPLLIQSATGQLISSYVTTISGPKGQDDEDGPEELHVVILDNGRSGLLEDPELREALYCIKCGACLNACPVYRKVGGHSYGWVYSGPIGAVVSPIMTGLPTAKDLPYASSLCGACREACPVQINIPRMLLHLRKELVQGAKKDNRNVSMVEQVLIKGWQISVSHHIILELSNFVSRVVQTILTYKPQQVTIPTPLSGWTRYREFPQIVKPFRKTWRKYISP